MTQATEQQAIKPKLSVRTGASRKLLERKAAESAIDVVLEGEALEANFPANPDAAERTADVSPCALAANSAAGNTSTIDATQDAVEPPTRAAMPAPLLQPAPAPAWSAEDESAFQTLAARRNAAGFQRRGRTTQGQHVQVGTITPNPATVVAVIARIVAERGTLEREELVSLMAQATFPHAKARPNDKDWCQGYVAGAIRNGFLELVHAPAVQAE